MNYRSITAFIMIGWALLAPAQGNQFCQVELNLVIADKLAAKANEVTAAGALHVSEEIGFFCLEYICHGAESLAVAFCLLLHVGIRVLQNLLAVACNIICR